ncbi:hypothetical protein GGD67_002767 [Bradyrhizobium sp. IAR9]|uniref:hypothetical protein n=1 Tax=Bradyrhizobium sp. IAR9 TaxID=2663841 RepID=UPI0015CC3C4D|nr:hypothetical protein [Bradyrhizobium sp. IAR9]NYG45309.1 hypothetical protein [Bradyrhizobium sp. IAR9]
MMNVADLLDVSRFIRSYDAAAAQKGIRLSLGADFHEYISITQATPTKGPTYPNFRPDRSPIRSDEGFWMAGVDKNNKVAVLQAVRLYDLSRSNFAEHLESLKAFYADPAKHAHRRDVCSCVAPSARTMSGKVAYHGDGWVRQDYRGKGVSRIMAAIAFGVSFAMWAPDFICGLVARWIIDKGVISQYGYLHHERGGSILRLVEEEIIDDDWLIWLTGDDLRSRVVREQKSGLLLAS